MIKVVNRGHTKADFMACLSKFRRKTEDIVKDYTRSFYYERPQEKTQRKRRSIKRAKRMIDRLKRVYGYKSAEHIESYRKYGCIFK